MFPSFVRNQELWNQRVRVFNHTFVLLNFRSTIVDYHHKFICCLVIISRFLVIIPMLHCIILLLVRLKIVVSSGSNTHFDSILCDDSLSQDSMVLECPW